LTLGLAGCTDIYRDIISVIYIDYLISFKDIEQLYEIR